MSSASDLSDGVQAVLDALTGAVVTPGDQVRVLLQVLTLPGSGAGALLCRRLTLVSLAQAAAAYEPTSYDDAQTVLGQIGDAFDAEITLAGDADDDADFSALQVLRAAVVADLTARGASLAPLVSRTFGTTLPSLVVAQALYGDATRESDLVQRVDPIHPLFMPPSMLVLGS